MTDCLDFRISKWQNYPRYSNKIPQLFFSFFLSTISSLALKLVFEVRQQATAKELTEIRLIGENSVEIRLSLEGLFFLLGIFGYKFSLT